MKTEKLIVKKDIHILLSEEEKVEALQKVNENFTGKKQVPLDQKVSEEHLEATRRIISGYMIEVELELLPNGKCKVLSSK